MYYNKPDMSAHPSQPDKAVERSENQRTWQEFHALIAEYTAAQIPENNII